MHEQIKKNKKLLYELVEELVKLNVKAIYAKDPNNVSVFSDIDLYVVAEEEDISKIYLGKDSFLPRVAKTLIIYGNKYADGKVSVNVVFDTKPVPLKIDFNFKLSSEVIKSEKVKSAVILYDPKKIVEKARVGFHRASFPQEADKAELQRIIYAFCGWTFNTFSKIKKGQYEAVIFEHFNEYFENAILKLYFANKGEKAEGFYEACERIDMKMLEEVRSLKLAFTERDLVRDLQVIVKLYKELARNVCDRYSLDYPEKAIDRIEGIIANFDKY